MIETIKKIQVDGVDYDIQAKELTKVTYAELREMRDNGSLAAGHLYRITDYEFTTVQDKTKSAGHVFDIIVLAIAENQLSHIARAIAHEGDTYFDGNDLGAWELWYDLDNDAEKYEWADAENGKGVIYRMIDEKRNDCPYDFKNALFYNENYSSQTPEAYQYTFSYVVKDVLYDGTVEKQVKHCYDNSMGAAWYLFIKMEMNRNVFRNNSFESFCNSNKFGYHCSSNKFGDHCSSNKFGDHCSSNKFGYRCNSNKFGDHCGSNTFGYSCSSNTFGYQCEHNTFGYNCNSNKFGDYFRNNTFEDACFSNTFGNNISYSEVKQNKTSITLNDEYFDDGSGQLVPIKHPDLSTQPSILPYKFMGQYVYEQLMPIARKDIDNQTVGTEGKFIIAINDGAGLSGFGIAVPYMKLNILSLEVLGDVIFSPDLHLLRPLPIASVEYTDGKRDYSLIGLKITCKAALPQGEILGGYVRIVYTSMPEEGDYYGYNSY